MRLVLAIISLGLAFGFVGPTDANAILFPHPEGSSNFPGYSDGYSDLPVRPPVTVRCRKVLFRGTWVRRCYR
jgi:hypothetical protein